MKAGVKQAANVSELYFIFFSCNLGTLIEFVRPLKCLTVIWILRTLNFTEFVTRNRMLLVIIIY